jgi:hypothetical protein
MNVTSSGVEANKELLHFGGYGQLIVVGDFGGNEVALESKYTADKTGTWIPQDSTFGTPVALTGNSAAPFLASRCQLRLNLTGGGAPDLNWFVAPLPLYVNDRG